MLNDTIQRVPDEIGALGSRRHTFRYNDVEFDLQAVSHPVSTNSNERAMKLVAMNMEANIRKHAMGMGLGQHLEPRELRNVENGTVNLTTRVAGKLYSVPLTVTPAGEITCPVSRQRFNSIRDVAAHVMDGLFEHNGVDNVYSNARRRGRPINYANVHNELTMRGRPLDRAGHHQAAAMRGMPANRPGNRANVHPAAAMRM